MPNETNQLEETRELPKENSEGNDASEKEVSFQNSFEEKLKDILSEPVAEETKKEAKKEFSKEGADKEGADKEGADPVDETSLDYNSLFEDVFGSVFDSEKDEEKMKSLKAMIAKAPHLKQMAMESPEKFALYFYRAS